ncbi:Hsp70 family protein [Mycolicibacterium wolinskyi]|uniref:Hsp70 family protein n=1 Tax=Mycolicibacterium wolinskyi TaxID=59750 RepID=UPI0039179CBE
MRDCLGLSVGTTNLVAITDQAPILRRTVLTLFGHRRPEVGVPGENPQLTEPGLVITDFVERVGDPVPLVAPDGSAHRGVDLLAEAVEAMTRAASPVRRPDTSVLAVPAHWRPAALDAVRAALPGVRVVPDSVAALTAIQAHPGLPARGVVALVDFGATGTSLTLADAGFATVGQTVRFDDFSGDLIDQEILRHVLADLDAEPSGTAAVATLIRLREQCRIAKERLSYQSATGLVGPEPGRTIRLTRAELEAVVAEPLDRVIDALLDLMRRTGIHPAQLAALVTVGGGARIPVVTQRLSEALRMPVTTVPQAQVIGAVGAGLLARRGQDETATRQAAVAPASLTGTVAASVLAWSAVDDVPEVAEFVPEAVSEEAARPAFVFAETAPEPAPERSAPWYRRGGVVLYAATFLALVGTVGWLLSARADRMDAAASAASLAPQTVPAESPLAQSLPAPPTRTVVVQEPAGSAPAQAAPRPAAAPRLVQSGQAAPAPRVAPRPAPQAAPRPAPRPAAPPPAPIPRFPVPQLPVPQLPIPQLPVPTFVPPTSTPAPQPEPTPTPEPTQAPEPEPEPEPTQAPEPEPTQAPEPEPTQAPAPEPMPEPAPEPMPEPTATSTPPSP